MTESEKRKIAHSEKVKRQIEVGKTVRSMIDAGRSNAEIAEKLGMPESVIRTVRERYTKG